MIQLTLTQVKRTPRVSSRTGKPFTSLGIKAVEYGNVWIGGFDSSVTESWKAGDRVTVESVEKQGQWLNFTVQKPEKAQSAGVNLLPVLERIALAVEDIRAIVISKSMDTPKPVVADEPFDEEGKVEEPF